MYNRYTRNDTGTYSRMPQSERTSVPPPNTPPRAASPHIPPRLSTQSAAAPERDLLNKYLQKLHLDDLDSGDLLLLLLLFLLFREKADEELLIALGLLLIL